MSAFLVDADHIDFMLTGALYLGQVSYATWLRWDNEHELTPVRPTTATFIGSQLINENIKSVLYRYERDTLETAPGPIDKSRLVDYHFQFAHEFHNMRTADALAQLAKAVNCYEYQSCEHPEWEESKAARFCTTIKEGILRAMPGYEEAAWEWDRATVSAR